VYKNRSVASRARNYLVIGYRNSAIGEANQALAAALPSEVETAVASSTIATGRTVARFATQRSRISADNFARASGERVRFRLAEDTGVAVALVFLRIPAFLDRGLVSEAAARFTLRINLESRLASFCILASSLSSFRPKLFSVIIEVSPSIEFAANNRARNKKTSRK
jgi:hypothetical protein